MSPSVTALLAALLAAFVAQQISRLLLVAGGDRQAPGIAAMAGAIGLGLGVAFGLMALPVLGAELHGASWLALSAAIVLLAGLWRDLGRGVQGQSLAGLAAAAVLAVSLGGVSFETVKLPFGGFIELGAAGLVLSLAWILAVALVVRALDPLPGLSAGLGFLAAGTFLIVALARGAEPLARVAPLTAPLAAVLVGVCGGLLVTGGRAGLSLGRAGAGLLGFMLAVLTVIGTLKHTAFLLIALPGLSLAVPALNALYMERQWRRAGRGDPAALDRARTLGDMLSRRGFAHTRAVALLLGLQAYCCLTALALVGLVAVPLWIKVLLLVLLLPAAGAAFFLLSRIAARVAVTDAGKVTILGVPIDAVTYESAEARMDEMIRSGRAHHIFTADVSGIMRAREEPELAEIIRTSDLVTADGAGVLWAARLFDFPLPERVSGVDLVRRLSGLAAREGYRVYLLGAAPGVAQDAAERLLAENPGLTIAGVRDGYFDDEAAVAEELRAARPDILFVALGIPKQERFIRRWYQELNIPLSIGIGGSFDVISGRLQRAPGWMQRAGLEWLFRVAQEPKRWRRLAALPRFVLAIGLDAAQQWRARGRRGGSGE